MDSIGVVIRRWVWFVGAVVRRKIDFFMLLFRTPLVLALFSAASLLYSFKNCFLFLYDYAMP